MRTGDLLVQLYLVRGLMAFVADPEIVSRFFLYVRRGDLQGLHTWVPLVIHHSSFTTRHTPLIIQDSSYITHHTPLIITQHWLQLIVLLAGRFVLKVEVLGAVHTDSIWLHLCVTGFTCQFGFHAL